MKYLAAYALLALSGKKKIEASDVKRVLEAVQANVNDSDIDRLMNSLKGKTIHQLIAQGQAKLGGATDGVAQKKVDKPKEDKKKEVPKKEEVKKVEIKKEEPKEEEEEEDFGLGGGLFD